MKRIKKDVDSEWFLVGVEWLLIGVIVASEWAGFQIAVFTPDISIPIYLLALWILVQVGISFCLVSQVWHALQRKEKEAWRLLNMAVLCIALQGLGIFRSHQLFAGAAAITDGFLLYLAFHWG